jgi:rhodanese-related sulfurtransferase
MTAAADTISPQSLMSEVLEAWPGAQRALFRKYHIGGCSSCAFRPEETQAAVCARNHNLDVGEVLTYLRHSHDDDAKILIAPAQLADLRRQDEPVKLLDVRSREEFEAVRLDGSMLMSQATVQEIMGRWPREEMFVIIDHDGRRGLDAAAYFTGHGFTRVRCLRGGIDAWAREVDPKVRRYKLA